MSLFNYFQKNKKYYSNNGKIWIPENIKYLENYVGNFNYNFILNHAETELKVIEPEINKKKFELLSLIVSNISNYKNNIKILEFGGNNGSSYQTLKSEFDDKIQFYHIIERKEICEIYTFKYKEDETINYFENILETNLNYDIIFSRSSLHYFDNWKESIYNLLKKGEYLLYNKEFIGLYPTFKTLHIKDNTSINLINIKEFDVLLFAGGFHPCFYEIEDLFYLENQEHNLMDIVYTTSGFFKKIIK